MQDRPTHTSGKVDVDAWLEESLVLNPWACGLTIDENDAEFAAARRKATLARHAEGKEAWNAWANEMLVLKRALGSGSRWAAKRSMWLALASAAFSRGATPLSFEAGVSFVEFVFPSAAWFSGATFRGVATFAGATFHGEAAFRRAAFCGAIRFNDVTFSDAVRFSGATFHSVAGFQRATFGGETWFGGATFGGAAWFEDATFRYVPSFIGAAFKGTLRLDYIATPQYPWLGYTADKDATANFRELRRLAVEAQDRDRELEFFAQEVRTGRFHAKGLPSWVPKLWNWRFWFGLAFGTFSDFGRSLWRPLLCWIVLVLGFGVFYLGEHDEMQKVRAALAPSGTWSILVAYANTTRDAWASPPACRVQGREPFSSTDAVAEAIQLSFRNALVFDVGRSDSARRTLGCLFGLDKDGDQQYLRISARVSTASTLQALGSGLLIFLFLLAVRNLLRLK